MFLQLNPKRPEVAVLRSLGIDKLLGLEKSINPKDLPRDNLWVLGKLCEDLFESLMRPVVHRKSDGEYIILALRILDLNLGSYLYSCAPLWYWRSV
jgi:hypothetical protein